jgi:hypothetical protein
MDNSTAYEIGRVAGTILVLTIPLGICVFFVIALVKACTIRSAGWIVAASLSGIPFLAVIIVFVIAFVVGLQRGMSNSAELAAAQKGEPSPLLTAEMTPVSGNAMAYQISLPLASAWQKNQSQPPFDCLFSYRDAYLGIIQEQVGLQTPENARSLSQKNIMSKSADCTFTASQPITIDSHSWLTFDATTTIQQIHLKYRFYVYADADNTVQIISWTTPKLFDRDAPVFDRIAKTFKMPK